MKSEMQIFFCINVYWCCAMSPTSLIQTIYFRVFFLINLEEESEDLASQMFPPRLFMVHDSSAGCENDVSVRQMNECIQCIWMIEPCVYLKLSLKQGKSLNGGKRLSAFNCFNLFQLRQCEFNINISLK